MLQMLLARADTTRDFGLSIFITTACLLHARKQHLQHQVTQWCGILEKSQPIAILRIYVVL